MPDGIFRSYIANQLEEIATRVTNRLVYNGGSVLIYCEAGRNRSSLLSALIVRRLRHISGTAALAHVLGIRPNAFSNIWWREWLERQP
jgi:protein-tyrosine phosphatase